MKQKSLTSFFGKKDDAKAPSALKPKLATPASTPKISKTKPQDRENPPSSPVSTKEFHTPLLKASSQSSGVMSAKYTHGSDGGQSWQETPPTSDLIDVDMISDMDASETAQGSVVKSTSTRKKRKIAVEDSDDDIRMNEPIPYRKAPERSKKLRMSAIFSDAEDEEEDGAEPRNTFAKRLTKFQKSPSKAKSRGRKKADDDDFLVPDDIDEDEDEDLCPSSSRPSSRATSRLSSRSSARSDFDEDEDEEDEKPKKGKGKKAAPSRPALKKDATSKGSTSFLTAAEQRARAQKEEKKSTESPYVFLQDPKDKDGVRPGEPGYDPRTLFIPPKAWKEFTPFEKQFWEIKQSHFDTILFFQKGKFLELMVGVPEMSFNFWAAKFLAKVCYKVGRMRLAADKGKKKTAAADKGKEKIVRRELNKVFTNGTLVDAELLNDEQAGHCVSLREEESTEGKDIKQSFGICVLDSATSEFNLSWLRTTYGNLSVATARLLKSILPGNCLWTSLRDSEGLKYQETIKELKKLYPKDEEDDELADNPHGLSTAVPEAIRRLLPHEVAIEALGAMIWYLHTLNIDKDILSMKNFNIYDPMKRGQGLVLDGQTLAHIEVLQNSECTEEGTLFKLLGRCITPAGKRLFRIWLCMPLHLLDHPTFEAEFTDIAKGLPDLERIVSRIHAKNCKVKDFLKVLSSFKSLSKGLAQLAETADEFKSKTITGLLRSAPDLSPNLKHIKAMFQTPEEKTDELIPEDGKDEVYDEIQQEIDALETELKDELKRSRRRPVQLQGKDKDKGPKEWTLSGSTAKAKRYLLKEARENRNTAIKGFKNRLYAEFDADRSVWLRAVRVLAELDCLFSLAKASSALGEPVCRPELVEGEEAFVEFEELRHPALCASSSLKGDFIPNDVKLGGGVGRIALLTGPNMGGKSTAMRMTATGIIMAQLGMLVPAKSAKLCPVDSILTRMGAYDNMFSNASTFKVELDECCKILRDATPNPSSFLMVRILLLSSPVTRTNSITELGRGTSTYDGMAIAGAVLHQLATHTLSLSFFATHYGSLTDDYAYHPNIRNMHMDTLVDDEKRELVFLYKLVDGVASSSFGTHVANLAGVPLPIVERADAVSTDFAAHFKARLEGKKRMSAAGRLPLDVQADFAYLFKLATGALVLPEDKVRQRKVLRVLKGVVRGALKETAAVAI
ncbi:DNA mismatch repair protein Msh6 [Epithele typhae]|uniref:DNA mismatch repair protein Msh6 n=1 Tax=Epithele typhae TaxID=378194 RepID=UPI00200738F3|nr:DNA mismatch repair protein Msh6 [Epithele typhae]KAH9917640.1 DNA mismatch repair protein Msh6 [Epithele typhae]